MAATRLASAMDLSRCKDTDADGDAYDSVLMGKIDPKRAFILKEADASGALTIHHCFDIDTLYEWVVRLGQRTSPESRRPLTPGEYNAIVTRYTAVHSSSPSSSAPPAPQCPLKIYRSHHHGKPVVAVLNPQVPDKWILVSLSSGRRSNPPPTLLTPAPGVAQGRGYASLQRDKDLPESQLAPRDAEGILTVLKDTFLQMRHSNMDALHRRSIQVYQTILQWDDHANPVPVGGGIKDTVKNLQALCRARGIPYRGLRKAELVAALQPRR